MFNSLLREFDEEPFFSSSRDPFQAHNERVRHMMRSFSEPFGGRSLMPSLTDGQGHGFRGPPTGGHPNSNMALRDNHREVDLRNPFSMLDNMMLGRSRMDDMHRNFENMPTDSSANGHSFSSSSVMTYSKVGDEPPKVFQASQQTRHAPGGIKEIRHALKDSESGVEKMSIGHHIQDRGHVVERKHNNKTGERELNQDFHNLDESEAQSFDAEWQREVSRFRPSAPMSSLEGPPPRAAHRAALTSPGQDHRNKANPKVEGRRHVNNVSVNGSGTKQQ